MLRWRSAGRLRRRPARELRFVRINRAAAQPNAISPDEHAGRTFAEVVGPTVAASAEPRLRRVLERGEPETDVQITGEWPDGRARAYATTFFPVAAEDGEIVGVGAIGFETSALVERELETELREREYERAVTDYATLLRHRLATPLTVIRGAAETLRRRAGLDEATRGRLLDLIVEQGAALERLALDPEALDESEDGLRPRPDRG